MAADLPADVRAVVERCEAFKATMIRSARSAIGPGPWSAEVRESDRRIRWRDRWWSLITVALAILGTLLGVMVGWWLRAP